ncbi:hypothetical protein HDU97_006804 [Phlyctochytrium planicorne]|nr:hypothetical protein HDU97_006804 [Phlyctochytrium planicorne]
MAETKRLAEADAVQKHWRRWGPYLSERAWATVREDYSFNGDAWANFPFNHSHLRTYRWGEDGIAGISDNHQILCFALALWNGKDRVIKERLFGVTGPEGNHGEDVKECYFYLDNVPTHSYMKYLYKYPQAEFPYDHLVEESQKRSRNQGEYELLDTGIFDKDEYFDVFVEYAKSDTDVNDIHIKLTIHNRSSAPAPLHVLPHLWFRNTWAWASKSSDRFATTDSESAWDLASIPTGKEPKPILKMQNKSVKVEHEKLGCYLHYEAVEGWERNVIFTENETNLKTLYNVENKSKYVKDGINQRVVHSNLSAVNSTSGTKCSAWYKGTVPPKSSVVIKLRLTPKPVDEFPNANPFGPEFDKTFEERIKEADEFYEGVRGKCEGLDADLRNIQRQAFAGMLWSKQFYYYVIKDWLDGDPGQIAPPSERKQARNKDWRHLHVDDILSMPDKWEYPFFAAWDTAFHASFSEVDPWFAKKQLILLTREWYLHPNGQLPAYEWNFSDVNPPVHAWAAYRIYKIELKAYGVGDRLFLERMFQKLLLNFTWWVNRKDAEGLNVFEGGFLGLDNIAVFNRSEALPIGGRLRQADGTSWMAMFCLNMLNIALDLASTNKSYEDIASKFFEHFMYISDALSWPSPDGNASLWNEEDGFYYDTVVFPDGNSTPLKVRSLVGLIPLFAVLVLEPDVIDGCPDFKRRMQWFLDNFDFTHRNIAKIDAPGQGERILLSLVSTDRLKRILSYMLDENEFLSPYGIRSLSRYHLANPYVYYAGNTEHRVDYLPAESDSGLFGGNSNWRGPIWMPTLFLIVESLQRFHHYHGSNFLIPSPSDSDCLVTLDAVADSIMHRTMSIFMRDKDGRRPVNGSREKMNACPYWRDLVLFYEYFHAENGEGLGASHQTGWTGVIAKMIQKCGALHKH